MGSERKPSDTSSMGELGTRGDAAHTVDESGAVELQAFSLAGGLRGESGGR